MRTFLNMEDRRLALASSIVEATQSEVCIGTITNRGEKEELIHDLVKFLRTIWRTTEMLEEWRISTIVPVFKWVESSIKLNDIRGFDCEIVCHILRSSGEHCIAVAVLFRDRLTNGADNKKQ
ncbi:hypothetical protein T265_02949 [Opisthorchis viverrini]|uniref:Uncharacterized protein n=1 Tax=Opisthorchis viverrini TaxID=6198 RepID=A0A074ZT53_OPIVI|nr:hypothetical protein T265_02949 [Opisthorchis viverrini]KER30593.1 hypothetical protein T265_02949 [Opisthorchis viverrini]